MIRNVDGDSNLIVCRGWATAYIVIIRNRVFAYNSGNPEPIWTKFYTVMGAQMRRFPGNFGQPRSRAAEMAQKKTNFLSGRQGLKGDKVSEMPFLSGRFALNLETTRESMRSSVPSEENCKIFPKRVTYRKNLFWDVFQWVSCFHSTDKLIRFRVNMTIPRAKDVFL